MLQPTTRVLVKAKHDTGGNHVKIAASGRVCIADITKALPFNPPADVATELVLRAETECEIRSVLARGSGADAGYRVVDVPAQDARLGEKSELTVDARLSDDIGVHARGLPAIVGDDIGAGEVTEVDVAQLDRHRTAPKLIACESTPRTIGVVETV